MTHLRVLTGRRDDHADASLESLLGESGFREDPRVAEPSAQRYLDTQDGRFHAAGLALLQVEPEGEWRLLGSGGTLLTAPGPRDALPVQGELADAVERTRKGRPLIPFLDLKGVRRLFRLPEPAGTESPSLAVLDLTYVDPHDHREVHGPRVLLVSGRPADSSAAESLQFLLARLPGGAVEAFHPLEEGLKALGLPLPGAPFPEDLRLSPFDPLAVAVGKVLRRQAHVMLANRRGLVLDLDPEYLHDLRVATRRAREALRLFGDLLPMPRRETVREELGRLARALGPARDLDVLLPLLPAELQAVHAPDATGDRILAALHAHRDAAHVAAAHAVESPLFAETVEALVRCAPEADADRRPAGEASLEYVSAALRRLRKRGRGAGDQSDERLHRVRIAAKRLRYVAEFFSDLEDPDTARLVDRLVKLQDGLGALQDARMAVLTYERLAQVLCADGRPDAGVVMTLGALAGRRREAASARREEFPGLWKKFRKAAKRFRRRME